MASMTKDAKEKELHEVVKTNDIRILERNLKRGLISRKDYDKFLKSLPDSKDKVRPND